MANIGIDIGSFDDGRLAKALRAAGNLAPDIAKRAVRKGGRIVLRRSKELVPVGPDPRRREGEHLKKTLKLIPIGGRRFIFGVKVVPGTREELGIAPNDKWYYPAAIEFGYIRKRRSGGVFHMPARSYLRRARDEKRAEATAAMEQSFRADLARFVGS